MKNLYNIAYIILIFFSGAIMSCYRKPYIEIPQRLERQLKDYHEYNSYVNLLNKTINDNSKTSIV